MLHCTSIQIRCFSKTASHATHPECKSWFSAVSKRHPDFSHLFVCLWCNQSFWKFSGKYWMEILSWFSKILKVSKKKLVLHTCLCTVKSSPIKDLLQLKSAEENNNNNNKATRNNCVKKKTTTHEADVLTASCDVRVKSQMPHWNKEKYKCLLLTY